MCDRSKWGIKRLGFWTDRDGVGAKRELGNKYIIIMGLEKMGSVQTNFKTNQNVGMEGAINTNGQSPLLIFKPQSKYNTK